MVGLFVIPWGRTFHWYCWSGSKWLMAVMVNANLCLSWGHRGIEKKQSLISMIIISQFFGKARSNGSPRWTGPNKRICALIALRSCNKRHLQDFFLITKIGVFQCEVEGSKWPKRSCSEIKFVAASNFSEERGHWGTHTGSSVFQVMGLPPSTAPRKNPIPFYLVWTLQALA